MSKHSKSSNKPPFLKQLAILMVAAAIITLAGLFISAIT